MIKRIFPAFLCFLPLLVLCSDNGSPSSPADDQLEKKSPAGVEEGDWSVSLPADTLGNTMRADLMLNPNQSFEITFEHSEYPGLLFAQTGTYSTDEDGAVTFHPEACSGLDSASGELVPIADSLCTTGFAVPGPDSESSWRISGTDLGLLLDQLPLSDEVKSLLPFLSLVFEKDPE